MLNGEVYRSIASVDLAAVLPLVPGLPFFTANVTGSTGNPDSYRCDVVLADKFPPELKAVVGTINELLGGRTARAILRSLPPRQSIPPHTDTWMPAEMDWRRFQLPIITHPDIIMRWPDDGVSVHLEAGTLYEVRYDRTHEVIHGADISRVHLQIDQVDATA